MTLRSLEIFVSVAKNGKMSDAANELHIAQPTISQAIAELEKEYGGTTIQSTFTKAVYN